MSFFFFFFLNIVCSSSKQQNTQIWFLWEVVELQAQFCLPKFVVSTPNPPPHGNGALNNQFLNGLMPFY